MHEIDLILTKLIEKNKTPSVQYFLFNKDNIIHKFVGGFTDIKNQIKVDEYTTYCAFSVTKTFTALAILQLAEMGKFSIDDPVKKHLPDFPYSSDIRIWQLMAHSAGIPNPNPLSWIHLQEEHQAFDSNIFFNHIFNKHNKTKSKPNKKFAYSNLGYIFLARLIEKFSGQNYEDFVRDFIIKPLDVYPSELDFDFFNKNNHAKGYQKHKSLINYIMGFFIDKSKFMDAPEGIWIPFKRYYVNGTAYGGLIGTPLAFVKYIQELLQSHSKLLNPKSIKMLFTENLTSNGKASGMGLSWFSGNLNSFRYFAHPGGGGGYYCEIRIYPELKMGSVIMFNRTGMTNERILDKLDRHYIKIY